MQRIMFLVLLVATLASPGIAKAVWPMPHNQTPPLTVYPCNAAEHPCNSCNTYTREAALQIQGTQRSVRSNVSYPTGPLGICAGYHDWCIVAPQLDAASASIYFDSGGPGVQFSVLYDIPNNYCLVHDVLDDCHASYWPIPNVGFSSHLTRLQLYDGATLLHDVPAIFENGTWMPTTAAGCDGSTHTYTLRVTNGDYFPECSDPYAATQTVTVTFPLGGNCTPDPRPCPGCDQ